MLARATEETVSTPVREPATHGSPGEDAGSVPHRLPLVAFPDVAGRHDTGTGTLPVHICQAKFQRLVADLAVRMATVEPLGVDQAISGTLRQIADALHVDRAWLWRGAETQAVVTHVWSTGDEPAADGEALATAHVVRSRVQAGEPTWFTNLDEVSHPADRATFRRRGIRSAALVPVTVPSEAPDLRRTLALASTLGEYVWTPATLEQLRTVALVIGHALARQATARELQAALGELERMRAQERRARDAATVEIRTLRDRTAREAKVRREVRHLKGSRMLATESGAARQVLTQIEQVAPTTATVLMLGETGSGKEVFAEALHELSPRRQKHMVRVNCAAIPTTLVESELFGCERGAYTGAFSRHIGRFEAADGSTLFLDEVGDLPLEGQVKLLRVLQDRVIERLGSSQPIRVNVRVIAATNRNLEEAVAARTFREDLFYRLNVFPIHVPPLRERREDIPTLTWSFIDEFATAFGKQIQSLSKDSLRALQAYDWPGNVRELRNTIERAIILATGPHLHVDPPRPTIRPVSRSLRFVDVEMDHIRSVLTATCWRVRGQGGAADLLGMKPTTLESRMAKLGIVRTPGTAGPSVSGDGSRQQRH